MRFTKMLRSVVPAAIVVATLAATGSMGQSEKSAKADTAKAAMPAAKQLKPQTTCPVMGGQIDKKLHVDYKGKRIYVCCPGCIDSVKNDPEKYIRKLEKMGQSVETIAGAPTKDLRADTSAAAEAGYWTCPMHPQIHQAGPGQCPICGMNLVYKKVEKKTKETKGVGNGKMKM